MFLIIIYDVTDIELQKIELQRSRNELIGIWNRPQPSNKACCRIDRRGLKTFK
jgi:hypothetical protein